MCGRYSMTGSVDLVRQTFDVEKVEGVEGVEGVEEVEGDVELRPRWNVAPTQEAPIVRLGDDGKRRLGLLRWGLLGERPARGAQTRQRSESRASPDAGKRGPARGPLRCNARSESIETLPAFRDAFAKRRCLVPADGFYEWLRLEGRRHPFHIRRRDRRLLAFAGIWSHWGRGGSFTILTCPPSDLVRPLHDRMPVILPAAAWQRWLGPADDAAELRALLVPWQGDELEAVPVSPFVNRADNEGPECLREVAPPVARQLSLLPS